MKNFGICLFSAAMALTLSTSAFSQADSTMRRNFVPAAPAIVGGGGNIGYTVGTMRTNMPGAGTGPLDCFRDPGTDPAWGSVTPVWFNNTNNAAQVTLLTFDSGVPASVFIPTSGSAVGPTQGVGWTQVVGLNQDVSGSGTAIIAPHSAYCIVGGRQGRSSFRVDGLANGMTEADYMTPVSAVTTLAGTCDFPPQQVCDQNLSCSYPPRPSKTAYRKSYPYSGSAVTYAVTYTAYNGQYYVEGTVFASTLTGLGPITGSNCH